MDKNVQTLGAFAILGVFYFAVKGKAKAKKETPDQGQELPTENNFSGEIVSQANGVNTNTGNTNNTNYSTQNTSGGAVGIGGGGTTSTINSTPTGTATTDTGTQTTSGDGTTDSGTNTIPQSGPNEGPSSGGTTGGTAPAYNVGVYQEEADIIH